MSDLLYTNEAIEDLEEFVDRVRSYIFFYAERIAIRKDNDGSEITVDKGDVIETIDCIEHALGREFFEHDRENNGKWIHDLNSDLYKKEKRN